MEQQEKKRINWALPWIIAGVLAVVLIAYLWLLNNREEPDKPAMTESQDLTPRPDDSTVTAYIRFIDRGGHDMNLEHDFTSNALHKLADAAMAIAEASGLPSPPALDSVHIYAENITEDKFAVSHADDIRRAADIIAGELQSLQDAKYPALASEAADMASAAGRINPDKLTLDQREEVKGFFRSAAALLKKMH